MCGVVGFSGLTTEQNLKIIHNLIHESKIRGLHSTGVSYILNNTIKTIKVEIPADKFLENHWSEIYNDLTSEKTIKFIGHTRYSTSEIGYPQPIFDEMSSVVLNGVITQADFTEWEKIYSLKLDDFQTRNDAEIFFKYAVSDSLAKLYSVNKFSASAILLSTSDMKFIRTNDRPLYRLRLDSSTILASTKEILRRSIGEYEFELLKPGILYDIAGNETEEIKFDTDLQIIEGGHI